MESTCYKICQVILALLMVFTYDLLEDMRQLSKRSQRGLLITDDVT